MIYNISSYVLGYLICFLFGILDSWNKKVGFFVLVTLIIVILLLAFTGESILTTGGYWWEYVLALSVGMLGHFSGRATYNLTFKS